MDKIKCIRSENGTIIPIHNIAVISAEDSSHYIWTNSDCDSNNCGHKLSDRTYKCPHYQLPRCPRRMYQTVRCSMKRF